MYYAIGDIHGRLSQLKRLYDKIIADIRAVGDEENYIIFLGDYMDRGPEGFGVLDFLASLRNDRNIEHVFLKGNHEDLFMGSVILNYDGFNLDTKEPNFNSIESWLNNGGHMCLREVGCGAVFRDIPGTGQFVYNQDDYINIFWKGFNHQKYTNWLEKNLVHYYEADDYVFVHAGLNVKYKYMGDQTEHNLLWGRYLDLNHYADYHKMVIHGHSTTGTNDAIWDKNRINVDTSYTKGVGWGRSLTAVVLPNKRDDKEIRFLQVIDGGSSQFA